MTKNADSLASPPVYEIFPDISDTNYLQIILIINHSLKTTVLGIVNISESKADFLSKGARKAFSPPHLAILYFVNNRGSCFPTFKKSSYFCLFKFGSVSASLLVTKQYCSITMWWGSESQPSGECSTFAWESWHLLSWLWLRIVAPEPSSGEDCEMAAGPLIDFKNVWLVFQKRLAAIVFWVT